MQQQSRRRRVLIMGAAGRDFHNFNMVYRGNAACEVLAFTAAQIPGIGGRVYPAALAGPLYPKGVPVIAESELSNFCREHEVDDVVFAYSDVSHAEVMHKASIALAAGADFKLLGPRSTMLESAKPVIAICAVRTGVGKSQVTRWLSARLKALGLRVAVIRHPMPYGDLEAQAVQRFANHGDLLTQRCTLEEREEYEPHIAAGTLVFAGVDYAHILAAAEKEADIILWDGGNNDFPFIRPGLMITLVDALRPNQTDTHHPGETVLRMADVVLIAKASSAPAESVAMLRGRVRALVPAAKIVRGASVVSLDDRHAAAGKRVLVVEDGPTMTHGGMSHGAGHAAAIAGGAGAIIDPRPFAKGELAATYRAWPHIGPVLPAMGYSPNQLRELEAAINAAGPDLVIAGTPVDLASLIVIDAPIVRARYDYREMDTQGLGESVDDFLRARGLTGSHARQE